MDAPTITRWITPATAARQFGVTRRTLYRWIAAGLPTHQPIPNGYHLLDADEVEAWVRSK